MNEVHYQVLRYIRSHGSIDLAWRADVEWPAYYEMLGEDMIEEATEDPFDCNLTLGGEDTLYELEERYGVE